MPGADTRGRWDLLLIGGLWLWLFPYSAALNNPNERTRVLQARAIAEYGQLHIGEIVSVKGRLAARDLYGRIHGYDARRGNAFVNDVALRCTAPEESPPACAGRIYPAKPPGAALLGVPALLLGRGLGFVPAGPDGEIRATWVLRYGGVAVWVLLGLLALGRLLRLAGVPAPLERRVVLAAGLGTAVLPYALMFVGHAVAGAAVVGGLVLLLRARHAARPHAWALAGGHVTAWAVLLEYHAVLAVLALAVYATASADRRRLLPGFAVGALLAAGLFAGLHQTMFGSPFKTGHFFLMSAHNRASQAGGFLGIVGFRGAALRDHLVDPYMGLLPLMPWLVVGVAAGVVPALRGRLGALPAGASRALAAAVLLYLGFVSCLGQWREMNGWSIGPRYLLPAMLPMAVLAGIGWHQVAGWRVPVGAVLARVVAGLAAAATVAVTVVTAAFPSPPTSARNPFAELALPLLSDGFGVRNLGVPLGLGPLSLVPALLLAAAAATWIALGGDAAAPTGPQRRWEAAARALPWTYVLLWAGARFLPWDAWRVLPATLPLGVLLALTWARLGWVPPRWAAAGAGLALVAAAVVPDVGALGAAAWDLGLGAPMLLPLWLGLGLGLCWLLRDAPLRLAPVALVVAGLWLGALARVRPSPPADARGAVDWCKTVVEGVAPSSDGRFLR